MGLPLGSKKSAMMPSIGAGSTVQGTIPAATTGEDVAN
jgi:hypothetical protein